MFFQMKKLELVNVIAFILLFIFAIIPLIAGLGYAIMYSLGFANTLSNGFTLDNYSKLFNDHSLIQNFGYTIILSIISLGITVVLSLGISLQFQSYFRKGMMSYLVNLPLSFPAIVGAFFFFQFLSSGGILARLFYKFGLINSISQFPNLINDQWSIGIIVTQTFISCPFFILLFSNIYKNQQIAEYLNLSYTLGANKFSASFKIAAPIMLNKSLPTLFLYFIFKLGTYEIPLLLGQSNPETISVMAVRKLQRFNLLDIPQGYAVAVLYAFLVGILLIVYFKLSKQYNEI